MPLQFDLLGSLSISSDGEPSELLKSPKEGQLERAVTAGQSALTETGSHNPLVTGLAWAILGRIAAQLGAPVCADPNEGLVYDAQDCFKQSLEVVSTSQWGRALVLWCWAEAEFLQGDKELGEKMWCEAREIFSRLNLPLMVAWMETGTNEG